jgi:geranylgeranyl pyrophosphate synthase
MPTTAQLDKFDAQYAERKAQIDERIEEVLQSQEDFAQKRKLLAHATKGGKRIRPVLTMLVADVYDAPVDVSLNHAAIVELIHNASLVADDRQDNDDVRRGAPTLWRVVDKIPFARKGKNVTTALTLMAGNGLLALAMDLADDPGVVRAMGHGVQHLADGFFREGQNLTSGYVGGGYDKYIETNRLKTGSLFAMASWMPATYVDAPETQEEAARKYGQETGVLYQIADDFVDDDLPSFIDDPDAELQKWYENVTNHIDNMPEDADTELLEIAPAYMVYRMLEQADMLDEVDAEFLGDADEDGGEDE